jgi:hypothetical protein
VSTVEGTLVHLYYVVLECYIHMEFKWSLINIGMTRGTIGGIFFNLKKRLDRESFTPTSMVIQICKSAK